MTPIAVGLMLYKGMLSHEQPDTKPKSLCTISQLSPALCPPPTAYCLLPIAHWLLNVPDHNTSFYNRIHLVCQTRHRRFTHNHFMQRCFLDPSRCNVFE